MHSCLMMTGYVIVLLKFLYSILLIVYQMFLNLECSTLDYLIEQAFVPFRVYFTDIGVNEVVLKVTNHQILYSQLLQTSWRNAFHLITLFVLNFLLCSTSPNTPETE
ncbi:hypothetical protein HKD37_12G033813 [Glycine soja]